MMVSLSNRCSRAPGALALALAVALLVLAAALCSGSRAEAALGDPLEPPPPNIVLITTDDQPAATANPAVMPRLFSRLASQGTSFSDYIVTTPLCCPSRATLLTGQYGHNHGVLRNDYSLLRDKRNVLPVWLQRGGYSTAHVGKYLNGFGEFAESQRSVAPGWDLWFTQFEKKGYYEWDASKNGERKSFGSEDGDHLTEVTNRFAARWTRRLVRRPAPFFLQLDYYAPHGAPGRDSRCAGAPVPAPADEGSADSLGLPRPPSFNEADVSDKPIFIQERPLLGPGLTAAITRRYRCTIESLRAVDRGIEKVFRKVEQAGELDRTVFVFTSDNGYFYGEHRIDRSKPRPYEENLRMPLIVSIPDAYLDRPAASLVDASTANLDIAPTLADLAGVEPCLRVRCRTLDGRSLLPLIERRGGWPEQRSLLVERNNCDFRGIRVDRQIYLEHGEGPVPVSGRCMPIGVEHYDLRADPFQLQNLYPAPRRSEDARLQRRLQAQIPLLVDCAGIAGRDPRPPSGNFCE